MIVAALDPSLGVSSEILQNVGLGAHRDFDETLDNIDGLMQERRNSIALAMELRLSCINPPICDIGICIHTLNSFSLV